MNKGITPNAVLEAVEEAVHIPTFKACLAKLSALGETVTDDACQQSGGCSHAIAARLRVDENEVRKALFRLRDQGKVRSVRCRLSEMTVLWWYDGLAARLVDRFPGLSNQPQASSLMSQALASHPAIAAEAPIIPVSWDSDPSARVILMSGDNASGKSFVTKHLNKISQKAGYEVCCVSMRQRTGDRMFSAMVFGDERRMSTGQCSVQATLKAFRHANESENPCVIILDEPDIGLSAELADAMGRLLVEEIEGASGNLALLVVISHNRDLFRQMQADLEGEPWSTLYVGQGTRFADWLSKPSPVRSTDDLRGLAERSRQLYRAILDVEKHAGS